MNGIYCKWPSLYCVWSPPLPLYDRTQRCQISFIMTLLSVCWHLTKTIRWGCWFRFFVHMNFKSLSWPSHDYTNFPEILNQLNIWKFYKLFLGYFSCLQFFQKTQKSFGIILKWVATHAKKSLTWTQIRTNCFSAVS